MYLSVINEYKLTKNKLCIKNIDITNWLDLLVTFTVKMGKAKYTVHTSSE